MNQPAAQFGEVPVLLRGESVPIQQWIGQRSTGRICLHVAVVIAGTAVFGAAVGSWRDPVQGLYTAIKFPLILLLTTMLNGLLNGMLAPLLGLNLSFRQSLLAILMSFTIASAVLAAFSPLVWFLIWNSPPIDLSTSSAQASHSLVLIVLVSSLAFAGIAGNVRLLRVLRAVSGDAGIARRTLLAWLAGNLLLGSQLSWILRPFVGAPHLPVAFLRTNAFDGNFFETVFQALQQLNS